MTNAKRYLTVEVLHSRYGSDDMNACRPATEAYLECETGPWSEDDITKDERPVLKLVTRTIGGRTYKHAEPVAKTPDGHTGWMSGGDYVHSHDSRFPNSYPLSLHDRTETWTEYESMSQ
jgi:hypothetical protein